MINKFAFFIFVLIAPIMLQANIVKVSSINEVKEYYNSADNHTLGVFDVDNVLVLSENPAFQEPNVTQHKPLVKSIIKNLTSTQKNLFVNLISLHYPLQLVEPQTAEFIQDLQTRQIKLVALTGAFNGIIASTNVGERRHLELQRLGIDFSGSFGSKETIFYNFPPTLGSYPSFNNGILFTNGDIFSSGIGTSKGDLLVSFLGTLNWQPNKIIYVDDKNNQLEDVQLKVIAAFPDLLFIGLHYTGASNFPSPVIDDYDIVEQWQALADEAVELSDQVWIMETENPEFSSQ
jgi:hypothetical protein